MTLLPPALVRSMTPRSLVYRDFLFHFGFIGLFLALGILTAALFSQCGHCPQEQPAPVGVYVALRKVLP